MYAKQNVQLVLKSMILLHNNEHKVLCVTRLSYWIQSYWMQYACYAIEGFHVTS